MTSKKCCDTCKYYEWYYDRCNLFNCKMDARSKCNCYKERIQMNSCCNDNREELIQMCREKLIEGTNIEDSPEEMAVINNILFRLWQAGILDNIYKN